MISQPILRILALLALLLTFTTAAAEPSLQQRKRTPQNPADSLSAALGGLVSQISGAGNSLLGISTGGSTSPTGGSSSNQSSSSPSAAPSTTSSSSSSSSSHSSSSSSSSSRSSSSSAPPKTTEKSVSVTPVVVTVVRTTDGSLYTSFSSSTPPASTATGPASLSQSQSQPSGMTAKTKTTVIGVVVGIGGAIIIGGLFIVAWRIWGRGKREDETSDGLMGYRNGSSHGLEKSGSAHGGSAVGNNPFQRTLESYHTPARGVNASSNF